MKPYAAHRLPNAGQREACLHKVGFGVQIKQSDYKLFWFLFETLQEIGPVLLGI